MADASRFGVRLREHRIARALTQERLAERAGISANAVAALEAGRRRTPRLTTVERIVDALDLDDDDRAELIAAATSDADRRADEGRPIGAPGPVRVGADAEFPGVLRRFAFVGRPEELARLRSAWERHTRVVLVFGEAGAGKTRLVGEFARGVAGDASVLWGRCSPDRLGAFEPFVDPVRAALGAGGPAGALGGELQRIVPDLAPGAGPARGPAIAAPGVERRRLFDAVVELIAAMGRCLLVVDDVQWADEGSLALLAHLVASPLLGGLTIVGAVRSTDVDPSTAAALSDLRRRATHDRFTIAGLGDDDVDALVRAVAGDDVAPELVTTVAAATDGNPLFVAELTEHLLAQHWRPTDGADPVSVPVPVGVRETLTDRLAAVSERGQTLVRAGAVLGRTFDVDLAARLADLTGDELLAALDDALDSGLVGEVSARELTFSHALVQAAVYETMSARRRLDAHRRAASLLEAHKSDLPVVDDAIVDDIARHWEIVAADDESAIDDAVRWTVRAGDAAVAAADVDEAVRRYRWAERHWTAPTRERAEVLLKLGNAYSARSETGDADERLWGALSLADGLDDVRMYADAAIGLAATVRYGEHDPARIEALERAIRELPPDEHVRRVTAASMLKRQLGFDPSADAASRRRDAAEIVLAAVSVPEPPRDLLTALGAARDAIVVDDPTVLARVSRAMVTVAQEDRNLSMLANAWYGTAWAASELADAPAWQEAVAAFRAVAEELALPYELALAEHLDATTAQMEGRYADAAAAGERALELAAGADPNAVAIQLTNAVLRGIDTGEAPAVARLMIDLRPDMQAVPTFTAGLAMAAAFGDAPEVAREILDAHAVTDFADVRRDLEWLPVIGLLCSACVALGEPRHAATLYDLLGSHPARALRVGPLGGWWGPTDAHLGALCSLLDRHDEAETRLRRAIAICTELGARPWQARCEIALADLLQSTHRGRAGEVDALRARARIAALELGAGGILALLP
jgi:transcriptional regulator with XRE-family HTH domain/tetratricopeptide (TPR) repeat protein